MLRALAMVAAALALCAGAARGAADLRGRIVIAGLAQQPPLTLQLDGGARVAFSRVDGSFAFEQVADGEHQLEVLSVAAQFPVYSVLVEKGQARLWFYNAKNARQVLGVPLRLEPFGVPAFFEQRKQMNIMAMFMNPMGLMMMVTMAMLLFMPKMSPEDKEEMAKRMKDAKGGKGGAGDEDPNEAIQKMLPAFMGGGPQPGADSDSD
jgi:hypothetical protein